VVDSSQAASVVDFNYDHESDAGPYPIPNGVAMEGGDESDGDRHAIIVVSDSCTLYELFGLYPSPWSAGSGAIWSLPGLVRYEEVAAGHIDHAIRFTVSQSRRAYVYPHGTSPRA